MQVNNLDVVESGGVSESEGEFSPQSHTHTQHSFEEVTVPGPSPCSVGVRSWYTVTDPMSEQTGGRPRRPLWRDLTDVANRDPTESGSEGDGFFP